MSSKKLNPKRSKASQHQAPRPQARSLKTPAHQDQLAAIVQRARAAPETLTPGNLLQLQRALGNQAVNRYLLDRKSDHPPLTLLQRDEEQDELDFERYLEIRKKIKRLEKIGAYDFADYWREELANYEHVNPHATTIKETKVKKLPKELRTLRNDQLDREKRLEKVGAPVEIYSQYQYKEWWKGQAWLRQVRRDYGRTLKRAGLDLYPLKTNKFLTDKFPKGPLITDRQYGVFETLSQTEHGRTWLSYVGLFTVDMARQYLIDHKYQTWLKLDAANRVLLAYLAWRKRDEIGEDIVRDTPPYRLGRSMDAKDESIDPEARQEYRAALDEDIREEWRKTLLNTGLNREARAAIVSGGARDQNQKKMSEDEVIRKHAAATEILKKVLMLLHAGLQVYDKDEGVHEDYTGAVVRALSHGGRVTIRVPALQKGGNKAYTLTEWLGITDKHGKRRRKKGIFKRAFGTHHIAVGKNTKDNPKFREQGGKGAAVKSKLGSTQMWGVNLAAGGLGQRDFNGDVILPDGAHGHMLIFFRPPTLERDGALMIGIETTGPHAASTVGYKHTAQSSEATANPESSFGGLKSDKIGSGGAVTLDRYGRYKDPDQKDISDEETNARLVDLGNINGGAWLGYLKVVESQFNLLAKRKGEVAAVEKLIGERQFSNNNIYTNLIDDD